MMQMEKSFLIVTDSQDKSKDSVFTFIMQLVDELKFQPGEELIVYSDGQSSAFKKQIYHRETPSFTVR